MVAIELLKHVIQNQNNPVITYSKLAEKISKDFNPRNLDKPLGVISSICKENNLPLISGIVVNKETRIPGDGFFHEFYNEREFSEWENIYNYNRMDIINCTKWCDLLNSIRR